MVSAAGIVSGAAWSAQHQRWTDTQGWDMKEPERFAPLRITGKYGGSVVVELNDSAGSTSSVPCSRGSAPSGRT
ncbi:hypothetical protein GCM10010297_44950 [Streptomyces malachitofuscus]|nr:hypothetical protein GCM10010297_44950 [Streptomyces malachitofuscus]